MNRIDLERAQAEMRRRNAQVEGGKAVSPKAHMPKAINAPAELVAAAEVALKSRINPKTAGEMIRYLMFRRTLELNGADQTAAGLVFGMSRSHFQSQVKLLESRLT